MTNFSRPAYSLQLFNILDWMYGKQPLLLHWLMISFFFDVFFFFFFFFFFFDFSLSNYKHTLSKEASMKWSYHESVFRLRKLTFRILCDKVNVFITLGFFSKWNFSSRLGIFSRSTLFCRILIGFFLVTI